MRFMGAKGKLLQFIYESLEDFGALSDSKSFTDVFSGTASVGSFFKQKDFEVFSSDLLYLSYVLQRTYIENGAEPDFSKLSEIVGSKNPSYIEVIEYLNDLPPVKGYTWRHFTTEGTANDEHSRMFFIPENGMIVDAIRQKIEDFHTEELIDDNAYFILLATLLESLSFHSNVSGVYAAFLKTYDPRALKIFKLRPVEYSTSGTGKSFWGNGLELAAKQQTDILYLDPPYNSRQYAPNYHVIETVARYDNPDARGKAGIREYSSLKSNFCSKAKALEELEKFVTDGKYRYLALSYNTEGIMNEDDILKLLSKYGRAKLYRQEYLRFKSNNNGDSGHKKHVEELIFIMERQGE